MLKKTWKNDFSFCSSVANNQMRMFWTMHSSGCWILLTFFSVPCPFRVFRIFAAANYFDELCIPNCLTFKKCFEFRFSMQTDISIRHLYRIPILPLLFNLLFLSSHRHKRKHQRTKESHRYPAWGFSQGKAVGLWNDEKNGKTEDHKCKYCWR